MAKLPTPDQLLKAVVFVVIVSDYVVESSKLPRPFPPFSHRGSRRSGPHRFGAGGSGKRHNLPTPPPLFRDPRPAGTVHRVSNDQGVWLQNFAMMQSRFTQTSRRNTGQPTAAPTGVIRLIPNHEKNGAFKMKVIETIPGLGKSGSTSAQQPLHDQRTFPAEKGIPFIFNKFDFKKNQNMVLATTYFLKRILK